MSIWKREFTLASLNAGADNTLISHLGIRYSEVGEEYLKATMPVTSFTQQPMGLLHGGASVVLAETLGSVAGNLCVDTQRCCVGLEINANHVRAKREGTVTGTTRPLHLGATTQLWQIEIHDEAGHLICTSRITLAVLKKK
ncbi:MAG: hotdog fold thioesterase [Aeromonadaceae bacterium]